MQKFKILILSIIILFPNYILGNEAKFRHFNGNMNTNFLQFNTSDDFNFISYPNRGIIFKLDNTGTIIDMLPINNSYEFDAIKPYYDTKHYLRDTQISNDGKYFIFGNFVYSFDERKRFDTLNGYFSLSQFVPNEDKIIYGVSQKDNNADILIRDYVNKSTDTIYSSLNKGVFVDINAVAALSSEQIVFWSWNTHYYYNKKNDVLKKLGESKNKSQFGFDLIAVSSNTEYVLFGRVTAEDEAVIYFDVYDMNSQKKVDSFKSSVHETYLTYYFYVYFSSDSKSFTYTNEDGNIVKRDFINKKSEVITIPNLVDKDYIGYPKLNTNTNQLFFQTYKNCFIYDLNHKILKPLVVFNTYFNDIQFSSDSRYYMPLQLKISSNYYHFEYPNYVFETGTNNIVYKIKDKILYYDFYTIDNDTTSLSTKVKFIPNKSKIFFLTNMEENGEYNLVVVDYKDENYRRIIPLGKVPPLNVVIDPQKMLFYVALENGFIKQFDYYNGNLKWTSERIDLKSNNQKEYAIHQLIYNEKKNELIAFQDMDFGSSFAIYVFDATTGAKITNLGTIVQTKNNIWYYLSNRHQIFQLSADGNYIYYPTDEYPESKLAKIELPSKNQVEPVDLTVYENIEFEYLSAPFSITNDGKRCINYRTEDGAILIWDIQTEQIIDSVIISPLMNVQPPMSFVKMPSILSWRLSPDERFLIFSNDMGILYIYDIEQAILSVNEYTREPKILELFPNPAENKLNYLLNEGLEQEAKITISNMLGTTLMSFTTSARSGEIDINKLNPGTYFLNIESGNKQITEKFIKY